MLLSSCPPICPPHLQGLEVKVWRDYEAFVAELTSCFPHEAAGIRAFYGECWKVSAWQVWLDLTDLEVPRYLLLL
jgi:prolycopene isomerase